MKKKKMSDQVQERACVHGNENRDRFLFCFSRPMVARAVLVLIASTFLLAIIAVALALGAISLKRTSQPPSFCCPSECRQLDAIVNDTARPCDNLYAYVCAGVVKNGTDKSEMLLRSLEEMILGLAASPAYKFATPAPSLARSRAGMFLQGLYSSCLAASTAKAHRDQEGHDVPFRFVQMAAALWDIAREQLAQLNEPNLLAFLLMINLRYQIRSLVEIQYLSSAATLLFYHDALELNTEMHLECSDCVAAAIMAYNRNVETSRHVSDSSQRKPSSSRLTVDDVGAFAENLHSLYPKKRVVERFVMTNVSQLWPAEQFVKALSILSWVKSPADVSVESSAPHQLVILRREITDPNKLAFGTAYLLAHTVARSFLTIPSVQGADYAQPACMELTTDMTALVNTAHWDLYGSPEKEQIVANMYRSVVDAVALEASSGLLVSEASHETHRRLRNLMSSITLLTAEAADDDAPEVPEAKTVDFAGNLLLGRSFQFEARKKRHRLGLPGSASKVNPVLHTGRRLYLEVPASVYSYLRTSKDSRPINMAVLGLPLANLLWSAVLRHNWDGASQGNVKRVIRCFAEASQRYSNGLADPLNNSYERTMRVAAASLALRTMMRAMSQKEWYAPRDVEGYGSHFQQLSYAQFFFLFEAYHRCTSETLRTDEGRVNVPVAYVPEFESAFQCQRTPLMERVRVCAFR